MLKHTNIRFDSLMLQRGANGSNVSKNKRTYVINTSWHANVTSADKMQDGKHLTHSCCICISLPCALLSTSPVDDRHQWYRCLNQSVKNKAKVEDTFWGL